MFKTLKPLTLAATAALLLTSCGKNPFGNNAPGGLQLFAAIGKAISKPSAVHDEQNNKDAAKGSLSRARATLGRAFSNEVVPSWRDTAWIERTDSINTYVYVESVVNKPCEDDAEKKVTGMGRVRFVYPEDATLGNVDGNKITNVLFWQFDGRELKTWNNEVCSLNIKINFANSTLTNIRPGLTTISARNITGDIAKGDGDTACIKADVFVESDDNGKGVQYGSGEFYDAHTGKDNTEPAKFFRFDLKILHKGTWTNYQDNEGIMTFMYPWGETGDSLHFNVHFMPNYERSGEIRKNGPDGALLVTFTGNDKYGTSDVVYYNEKGEPTN